MKILLAPAVGLMNILSFPKKFALLGLVAACAMFALQILLFSNFIQEIEPARRETAGIPALLLMSRLVQNLQEHRGLSHGVLSGHTLFSNARAAKEREVDASLAAAQAALPARITLSGEWERLVEGWTKTKKGQAEGSAEDNFGRHSGLIQEAQTILTFWADGSALTLDPDIDRYYLVDAVIRNLPDLLEHLGQLRARGIVVLSIDGRSENSLRQLEFLRDETGSLRRTYQEGLRKALPQDSGLRELLRNSAGFDAALDALFVMLDQDVLGAAGRITEAEYFKRTSEVIDLGFSLSSQNMMPALSRLIGERISAVQNKFYASMALTFGIEIVFAYLAVAAYLSFITNLRILNLGAARLAKDNLAERVCVNSDDELAQLADTFNLMAQRLNESFSSLQQQVDLRTVELTCINENLICEIDQRDHAEQALRDSEDQLRSMIETAPNGLLLVNQAGAIVHANAQIERMFAYPRDELLGQAVEILLPEAKRAEHDNLRGGFFHSNVARKMATGLEVFGRRKDGGELALEVGLSMLRLPEGTMVLASVVDVTELKRIGAALASMNRVLEERVNERTTMLSAALEQAKQADHAKNLFLSSMSHELRTPLNSVMGYAQLIEACNGLPTRIVDYAREIQQSGNCLLTLVDSILELARGGKDLETLKIENFPLHELLSICQIENSDAARAGQVDLKIDPNCERLEVRADRKGLLKILNMLVNNGVKYNRTRGSVTLACLMSSPGRVRLSVIDTGSGIALDKQAQLFQAFNRLGAEMGVDAGAGVSLVIARRWVQAMNGEMGVESTPGTGSCFWIELPLAASDAETVNVDRGLNQPQLLPSGKILRLLVAEDYVPNQNVLRQQLKVLGCSADIAGDGALALEMWRTNRYDMILTDMNMPVMDGLALTRAIRMQEINSGGHIPIVAITAAAEATELQRCREAGVDDALTKPLSLDKLRAILLRWAGFDGAPKPESVALAAPSPAVMDVAHLYAMLGEVSATQASALIATFVAAAAAGLQDLEKSLGDYQAVGREMHKQKSSARTVGAMRYGACAESVEMRAKTGALGNVKEALEALRLALAEVVKEAAESALDAPHDFAPVAVVTCASVLVVDDDLVVLQQMTAMLTTLGVAEVWVAGNGAEALEIVKNQRREPVAAIVCDLDMPVMDGIELVRQLGVSNFKGGLILMSGAGPQLLKTVGELAGLQGLRILGQVQKPVTPLQMSVLLDRATESAIKKPEASATPDITAQSIRDGMEADEFSVWFQPKVDSSSLTPLGVEALARWKRSGGTFVPPDVFIIVAEREGLIADLSQVLVMKALREGARLFEAGFQLKIAVNLSGRWLTNLNLPEFMLASVSEVGLDARNIVLEVTETGLMEDLTTALDVLSRLRIKGFGLSIDDFGIGYSSFEQIGRIPFTELKLDRSFVIQGHDDPAAMAILESSMDIARKLGLSTVAEGVETQAHLELVRTLGCDSIQGYLIARPMTIEDLLVWLAGKIVLN